MGPRMMLRITILAACALGFAAVAPKARAELLVLRCNYQPLTHVGNGPVKAGAAFTRHDVFEIDLSARRAAGAASMGTNGSWRNVVVGPRQIRLSNGDPSACNVPGRRGEEVVIHRYSGQSQRSSCMGEGSHWITLHWSGTCERIAKRAF